MVKVKKIEIIFPVEVELPDGWDQTLDSLVGIICKQYEKENPERVMWPCGHGFAPIWSEPDEPTFDESTYQIDVAEREDLHGRNPHNPNKD